MPRLSPASAFRKDWPTPSQTPMQEQAAESSLPVRMTSAGLIGRATTPLQESDCRSALAVSRFAQIKA